MKYVIIPFIALGLVLSLIVGVEYRCDGPEMFPIFYGSPFVFKVKSLGSSMEYFYSISGLLLNVVVWSLILCGLRLVVLKLIAATGSKKSVQVFYKGTVGVLILFSFLSMSINYVTVGRGFQKGLNYWYMNVDKEASEWGMKCKGEWKFLVL